MSFVEELVKRGWNAPRAVGTISAPETPEMSKGMGAQYYAIPTARAPIYKKLGSLVVGESLIKDQPMAQEVAAEAMIQFLDSLESA